MRSMKSKIGNSESLLRSLVVISAALLLLAAWTTPATALPKGWPERIVISSGPLGGPWYPASVKFSEYLMKKFPGLNVTVIEGGGLGNIRLLETARDAQIGITYSSTWYEARAGEYKGVKYLNARGAFALMTSYMQFAVRADSKIRSIVDLKNKRIVPGRIGWSSEIIFKNVLKQYGLDYNKIREQGGKVNFAGFAEMPTLLKDGHVDMVLLSGNSPHPAALDIESSFPLRILPLEKSKMEAVMKELPGLFVSTIPAGRYKGNKEPVDVLAVAGIYIVNKDLPDNFMYELTKAYIEVGPEARKLMPHLDLWSWEKGKAGIFKDLMHPGCLRAFEEAGYGFK